ncbi:hypothetical protein TWF718_009862 [Orbilia javanica]|uniref:Uncharacterized protein n=1 Tax=Orbilia javanica TaxID=47235 RepID=A0AAN8RAU6_9PEZI
MMKYRKRSREGSPHTEGGVRQKRLCHLSDEVELMEVDWHAGQLSPGAPQVSTGPVYTCFGALIDVKAEVTHIESSSIVVHPWTSYQIFDLKYREGAYRLTGPSNVDFGLVDLPTTFRLRQLKDFEGVSLRAIISYFNFNRIPRKPTKKKTRIDITVNIFGPKDLFDNVGDALGKADAFLQHPVFLEPETKYINPHYYYHDDVVVDLGSLVGPMPADGRSQRTSQAIEDILESLGQVQLPVSQVVDLESIENLYLVKTKLKPHQLDGIRFILSREDFSLSERADRELLQLINMNLSLREISSCRGGIVADAMGLGKTLTMLSAIACSRHISGQHLGPTLVVLPSRQVLDVWDAEIRSRFRPGKINAYCFHGDSRAKKSKDLVRYDIVLTTYHTLATDSKTARVLQDVLWLRIVLDEAHWVRNQSTQLFKAAESLKSETRWCLTGTPIQNSLHDLRSLLKFLRFAPLCNKGPFETHIIEPLRTDSENASVNLKYLLRTLCLRRGSSLLELPPLETKTVTITLGTEEYVSYQGVLTGCKAEFDRQVCMGQKVQIHRLLFATTMKLRRVCNHGTISPLTKNDRYSSTSFDEGTSTNGVCQVCTLNGPESHGLFSGTEGCPECGRFFDLADDAPSPDAIIDDARRTSANIRLPIADFGILSPPASEASSSGPQYTPVLGYSSKLNAVASNIKESSLSNSKSIVFTSWRATLDLLGQMLSDIGIKFLRIDGNTTATYRSSIITQFQQDASVPVLIMTIDSCAVGLTLTNADKVHMIEPQWNPAVEEQAIARAYRMGQTKRVTVIRYITERSVEQRILDLQAKKSRLAKFSMSDTADGDLSAALEDMRFVLNPEF